MSIWFLDAILVTIAVGSVAFVNKIFAERKYDQKFSAMILFGVMFIFSLIYLSFFEIQFLNGMDILLVVIWGSLTCFYSIIMMTALRYLPTSTYFVNVRLISSFILLFIGVIFFEDVLSQLEIMGFILGIMAMTLLFENERKEGLSYKKGLIVLFLGIVVLVVTHTISKLFSLEASKVPIVLVILFASSFLTSLILGYKKIATNKKYFLPIL